MNNFSFHEKLIFYLHEIKQRKNRIKINERKKLRKKKGKILFSLSLVVSVNEIFCAHNFFQLAFLISACYTVK